MLVELNEFAKKYEYLVNAVNVFFPLALTIFMAIIAYGQYRINLYLEYERVRNSIYDELSKKIKDAIFFICDLLIENDSKKNKTKQRI